MRYTVYWMFVLFFIIVFRYTVIKIRQLRIRSAGNGMKCLVKGLEIFSTENVYFRIPEKNPRGLRQLQEPKPI